MSKKGLSRHMRKFQAEQQVTSRFQQRKTIKGYGLFPDITLDMPDPKAVSKVINKVVR